MKISPATKETLVPGMRTGNIPDNMASNMPAMICVQAMGGRRATTPTLYTSTAAPEMTANHQ